uniref:EF-hand domain-containing protein n=1 Tax=Meloidogyne floridensis TaxID=298350 RepID=A0A915NV29_9BILA
MQPVPERLQCENPQECEEWYNLFRAFDIDNDGYIPAEELKYSVRTTARAFGLEREEADFLIAGIDSNKDNFVDFPEFTVLMARAKHLRLKSVMLYAARSVLPRSQQTEKIRYLLEYNCWPPPVFMASSDIFTSKYCSRNNRFMPAKCAPVKSPLILNPCKKEEVFVHLLNNLAVQFLLGIPLELVHKFWRIACLYFLGVICGALLFFVFDRDIYLAGASGGVYALLSAHIANIIINWSEMEFNWIRAAIFGIFVSSDIGVSVYQRYFSSMPNK